MLASTSSLTLLATLCSILTTQRLLLAAASSLNPRQSNPCFPATPTDTIADRMNAVLNATGATGYSLQLCPDTEYNITEPIKFNFPNQEIITQGFPGLDLSHRAVIRVTGQLFPNGTGHTNAVDGSCANCISVALRYVEIDGNRGTGSIITGGANIEFGAGNQNQLVEYVHSHDPRAWSCLHIAEGPLTCANATIRYNDIGPCGTEKFQEWSDGISLSCKLSQVYENTVTGATDGGIVIFGSPGSHVYNNTVRAWDQMQLGGINLVDYDPWSGDFTGVVVENNMIYGGFATNLTDPSDNEGKNANETFIKIGIAMGPRVWFGNKYGMDTNKGAIVRNNVFQGAFGYAMAAAVVTNWTVTGNTVDSDTTFIGSVGPNCSKADETPQAMPFVYNTTSITDSVMNQSFFNWDADSLTCILPDNGDFWPYVPAMTMVAPTATGAVYNPSATGSADDSSHSSSHSAAPLAIGIVFAVIGAGLIALGVRWYFMNRRPKAVPLY